MKKLLLALALLSVPSAAIAQCNGVFANNTVCGNITGSANLPRPTNPTAFQGGAAGSNGQIQFNNSNVLGGLTDAQVTARVAGTSGGGTTNFLRADGSWSSPVSSSAPPPPGGRLTLTSGSPVMASSQTASPNLFYAPYVGTTVPIYNGTSVLPFTFTSSDTDTVGLTLALGSSWTTNTNYDAFAYQTGGTVSLCTGPDWSAGAVAGSNAVGASSRGTGAGSTQLQLFRGLLTNQNTMTCRTANASTVSCVVNQCTYLGSFRTGAAGQISHTFGVQGTAGTFNLWNIYNQVQSCSTSSDGSASWTGPTSTTPTQQNASAVNQFNFMTGLANGVVNADATQLVRPATVVAAFAVIGIAMNSTTTIAKTWRITAPSATLASSDDNTGGSLSFAAVLGANFISMNMAGDGTNASTFFGQNLQSLRVCVWL